MKQVALALLIASFTTLGCKKSTNEIIDLPQTITFKTNTGKGFTLRTPIGFSFISGTKTDSSFDGNINNLPNTDTVDLDFCKYGPLSTIDSSFVRSANESNSTIIKSYHDFGDDSVTNIIRPTIDNYNAVIVTHRFPNFPIGTNTVDLFVFDPVNNKNNVSIRGETKVSAYQEKVLQAIYRSLKFL